MIIIDSHLCYLDLREHNSDLRLTYEQIPAADDRRVYTKYSTYPGSFVSFLAGLRFNPVLLEASEHPESLTTYIVRDIWSLLPQELTIFSSDVELIPALKAIKSLGSEVKVIAGKNVMAFAKEGLATEWLTNYALRKSTTTGSP